MNGRLAIAFGARGTGNAGFGGAARAHYEPVQRVINLTKMGGGGCLAHEWFHALDNMISEIETGKPTGKNNFLSEDPELLPAGKLRDAMIDLKDAILSGDIPIKRSVAYSEHDYDSARFVFTPDSRAGLPREVYNAGSLDKAIDIINDRLKSYTSPKNLKTKERWIQLAAALYGNADGGVAKVKTGVTHSSFSHEALQLDGGKRYKYWSQPKEMMARAFQSYCEDKLEGRTDRKNDYLSSMADNKYYKDPILGDAFPFPEGQERTRINAAFDNFSMPYAALEHYKKHLE